jgi:hypothetical protein
MGHERFRTPDEAAGVRPAAELARRLFATGQVDAVHIYSNIVTVDLAQGGSSAGLSDVVRNLYRYWQPGMAPPSFEDLTPDEEPAGDSGAAASTGDAGGDAALAHGGADRVDLALRGAAEDLGEQVGLRREVSVDRAGRRAGASGEKGCAGRNRAPQDIASMHEISPAKVLWVTDLSREACQPM